MLDAIRVIEGIRSQDERWPTVDQWRAASVLCEAHGIHPNTRCRVDHMQGDVAAWRIMAAHAANLAYDLEVG